MSSAFWRTILIINALINFSDTVVRQMSRLLVLHLLSLWARAFSGLEIFSSEKKIMIIKRKQLLRFGGFLFWENSRRRRCLLTLLCNSWLEDQWWTATKVSLISLQTVKTKKMTLKIKEKSEDFNHCPRFVLCWSHKQGAWDQRGVFHMYGNKDQPWLTIRLVKDEYLDFWKG